MSRKKGEAERTQEARDRHARLLRTLHAATVGQVGADPKAWAAALARYRARPFIRKKLDEHLSWMESFDVASRLKGEAYRLAAKKYQGFVGPAWDELAALDGEQSGHAYRRKVDRYLARAANEGPGVKAVNLLRRPRRAPVK